MKSILKLIIGFFLLLSLVSSCSKKKTRNEIYGDFRFEDNSWYRKKFMWPGEDLVRSEYTLYYKEEKVDFEKLAPDYLKDNKDPDGILCWGIRPMFYRKDSSVYCRLSGGFINAVVVLKPGKEEPELTPLISLSMDTSFLFYCPLSEMDSIGDGEVMYANFVVDEARLKVTGKYKPINRYTNPNGLDSTLLWAHTFYGKSPDKKILVRSFDPNTLYMDPKICSLFLTETGTGKTTEFPLMENEKGLVEIYSSYTDSLGQKAWFGRNFEWVPEKDSYRLKIKNRILTPESK